MCAALAGCQSHQPIDDAAITKTVKTKLAAAFGSIDRRQVRQLDRGANQETITYIDVRSSNGIVTLTGEVNGKRAKAKAGDIAHSAAHVVRVNNNLAFAPGDRTTRWATTKRSSAAWPTPPPLLTTLYSAEHHLHDPGIRARRVTWGCGFLLYDGDERVNGSAASGFPPRESQRTM